MVGKIMEAKRGQFEFTGTSLKLIAVITMLIDHIGAGLITDNVVLRGIGRMAFPIYCYMLIEGFAHTRNIKKYALRLLAIAVVSEVPFDYLFRRSFFDFAYNNVLWTLLLGLGLLYMYSRIDSLSINANLIYLCRIAVMFAGMALAFYLHVDYKMAGVACISVMYYINGPTKKERLMAFGMGVIILALMSSYTEIYALLMLIPMALYNGKRGADSKGLRLFFYLFYPVHLVILGLLAYVLKI